jgi:arylsulfatase A-like enzyme
LITLALVAGLSGGLLEGAIHLGLQRLDLLDNSWYAIIWISPIINSLVMGLIGVAVSVMLRLLPNRPAIRSAALFVVLLSAVFPLVALAVKEWVARYAIVILVLGVTMTLTRLLGRYPGATTRVSRRLLPVVAGLTIVAWVGIEGGTWLTERVRTSRLPVAQASDPNVLVVVIDALRADRLGTYGYPRATSPTIDRLAAEGALFENAFSTTSYTLPSHASMLTGRYPRDHKVDGGTSHNDPLKNIAVLPGELLARGYRTAAFSGNTFYFSREHGFGRGFLHFEDFFHSLSDMFWRTAYGGLGRAFVRRPLGFEDLPGRKRASDTNAAVGRWIGRDKDKPFFVMINYMDVHDPYLPPEPFDTRFSNGRKPAGRLNFEKHVSFELSPEEVRGETDAYDGAIAYADDQLGKLLALIAASGSQRELIVVITADHAEEFGEHKGFLHGAHLYREVLHVPLVIWRPGRIPAGVRIPRPVSNASIPSTVMALVDRAAPSFPLPSLVDLWKNPASADTWPLPIAELAHRPWAQARDRVHYGALRSVFDSRFHLMEQDGRPPELYDWIADPKEQVNLSGRPEVAAIEERLRAALR